MKFRVNDGFQVKYNGKMYRGGQTFDAPENSETQKFLGAGYVEAAGSKKSTAKKSTRKGTGRRRGRPSKSEAPAADAVSTEVEPKAADKPGPSLGTY